MNPYTVSIRKGAREGESSRRAYVPSPVKPCASPRAGPASILGALRGQRPAGAAFRCSGPAKSPQGHVALLRSLPTLLVHRRLRTSAGLGFCAFDAFSAFSAFWAKLAFHLASPAFGLGAAAAGLFGLWGAPGALLAPFGGRLADRFGSDAVNAVSLGFVAAALLLAGTLGASSAIALVLVVNLLDFGMQSGQVANHSRIFGIGQDIRVRLNTVYMVAMFGGGAFGSLTGTLAWNAAGRTGACLVSGALALLGYAVLTASMRSGRPDRERTLDG